MNAKARRLDPQDTETIDLTYFDFVECEHNHKNTRIRRQDGRLIISHDSGPMTIRPIAGNWIEIDL